MLCGQGNAVLVQHTVFYAHKHTWRFIVLHCNITKINEYSILAPIRFNQAFQARRQEKSQRLCAVTPISE